MFNRNSDKPTIAVRVKRLLTTRKAGPDGYLALASSKTASAKAFGASCGGL